MKRFLKGSINSNYVVFIVIALLTLYMFLGDHNVETGGGDIQVDSNVIQAGGAIIDRVQQIVKCNNILDKIL